MTRGGIDDVPRAGTRPKETMDRLEAAMTSRGMTILARIDHGAAAAKAGWSCVRRSS